MSNDYSLLAQTGRYYLFNKGSEQKVRNLILVDRRTGNYEVEYLFDEIRSWDRLFFHPKLSQRYRDNLPKTITNAIWKVINNETLHRKYDAFIEKITR